MLFQRIKNKASHILFILFSLMLLLACSPSGNRAEYSKEAFDPYSDDGTSLQKALEKKDTLVQHKAASPQDTAVIPMDTTHTVTDTSSHTP